MARYFPQAVVVTTSPRPQRDWLRQSLIGVASFLGLATAFYLLLIWPWISRWGATKAETLAPLPGDELITTSSLVTTKAVTIAAPPEEVWPWLLQLGVDRGGMYSYLWVENWLMRLHV